MISAKQIHEEQSQIENWQIEQLEKMLDQSVFDEERRYGIACEIESIRHGDWRDYHDLYFRLSNNQRDRISSGDGYGKRQINEHLRKLR